MAGALPVLAGLLAALDALEREVVLFVACRLHHPVLDPLLLAAQEKTVALPATVALLLVLARWRPRRALRAAFACALGFGVGMALGAPLWAAVDRPRPSAAFARVLTDPREVAACAEHPGALPLRKDPAHSPSFPSRHAITAGVFALVLWCASRWCGPLAAVYAALVALGRVYAGKHWPSDVLAGLLVGALAGLLAWRATPALFRLLGRESWVRDAGPAGEGAAGR